jgi:hypothetical protein
VPTATPIPRGPSVLTLYSAADLLTGPGCPVCRYADEACDRYLAWFALEAHAQAVTIARLCASLGMCARHTRGLMSQPGSAARLTAVYRYVVEGARGRLRDGVARVSACPACEHDEGAAGRALDTLLEDLDDERVRDRYRELGGFCLPHLSAASTRGGRRVISWLAETMMATVNAGSAGSGWLAGLDRDADVRAVLRQAAPAGPRADGCAACLAAVRAESEHLAWMFRASGIGHQDRRLLLCAGHLSDLITLAGQRDSASLLAWQAGCLAESLTHRPSPGLRWADPASWLRPLAQRGGRRNPCPTCVASADAGQRAVDELRASLRATQPDRDCWAPLCVRHLLGLRAFDPWAGHVAARGAVERADVLISELNEAFRKGTWSHRHEARGPEMTAWRRAAAFLDGGVFCGRPPRET